MLGRWTVKSCEDAVEIKDSLTPGLGVLIKAAAEAGTLKEGRACIGVCMLRRGRGFAVDWITSRRNERFFACGVAFPSSLMEASVGCGFS